MIFLTEKILNSTREELRFTLNKRTIKRHLKKRDTLTKYDWKYMNLLIKQKDDRLKFRKEYKR